MLTQDYEDPYERYQQVIEHVIQLICRRNALDSEEAEDFAGEARLKLLDEDRRVLREFRGESKITTYLMCVLNRLLLSLREKAWGKWRPSSAAKRGGSDLIQLEKFVSREGYSFDQAVELMKTNYGITFTREQLSEAAATLQKRTPTRRFVSDELLMDHEAPEPTGEDRVIQKETTKLNRKIQTVLLQACLLLTASERVLLRLRFMTGMKINQIAKVRQVPPRKMYSTLDALLGKLAKSVTGMGLEKENVAELLSSDNFFIELDEILGNSQTGPSEPSESD